MLERIPPTPVFNCRFDSKDKASSRGNRPLFCEFVTSFSASVVEPFRLPKWLLRLSPQWCAC